jgi:hypothetical protein
MRYYDRLLDAELPTNYDLVQAPIVIEVVLARPRAGHAGLRRSVM